MDRPVPVSAIASCYALCAFAVAIVSGLGAGRAADDILAAALGWMAGAYAVGLLAAKSLEVVVEEHVDAVRAAEPDPTSVTPDGTAPIGGE